MSPVWPDPETDALARLTLRAATGGDSPADRERLDDALRAAEVAAAFRAARSADPAESGEAARARLRARARPFLDRASQEIDAEHAARRARSELARDLEIAIAELAEPNVREAAYGRQERAAEALRELVEERQALRDEAARRCGASSELELLLAVEPVSADALAQPFETGAVAPFDDAVARAQRDWRRETTLRLGAAPHPVESLLAATLVEHAPAAPRRSVQRWMRELARALGMRPERAIPEQQDAAPGRAWSRFEPRIERGVLHVGWLVGPAAAACALGALGRGCRAGFLGIERGTAAMLHADPAFDAAAGTLFERLLLDPVAAARLGVSWPRRVFDDLGREARLAPRVAWAYVEGARSMRSGSAAAHAIELLERAYGRRATFEQRPTRADSASGASRLRGIVYALLLEERLRTRFGRAWVAERGAGAWIRELWEAEPGETAESLARHAGLGTMDASPVFEACRPRNPAAP